MVTTTRTAARLALIIGVSAGALHAAEPPFGGDDTGFDPPARSALERCENGVAKAVSKLAVKLIKCQADRARRKTDAAGEEACRSAVRTRFNSIKTLGCGPCTDLVTIAGAMEAIVAEGGGQVYCAPGVPFGGGVPGNIPADAPKGPVTRCETGVAKSVGKLAADIVKCHIRRASGKLDDAGEDACEATAITRFTKRTRTIGCDPCLDPGPLGPATEAQIDATNVLIYCMPVAVCGDAVLDSGEECDDGNTTAGDGCSAGCTWEPLCLVTNNAGSPAQSSLVKVATDGTLTHINTLTLPGNNTATGALTAARCNRRVYLTLADFPNPSAIAGYDVALDGTRTALPTLTSQPRGYGLLCNGSQNLLFGLASAPDFLGSAGKLSSYTIGITGALTPVGLLDLNASAVLLDLFGDVHPTTAELFVAEFYDPPVGGPTFVELNRVSYDLAGNLTLAQPASLAFGASSIRGVHFTADAGYLALPGYANGTCFSHWAAPGSVIPPVGSLNLNCGTPFPSDAKGFVPRPEGGPYFYYQSGTTLNAAEFSGTSIISHTSIAPVHTTNKLLTAFGGRLLVSLGPGVSQVATYDVAPNLVTVTPNDTVSVTGGPNSGVLLPCPNL